MGVVVVAGGGFEPPDLQVSTYEWTRTIDSLAYVLLFCKTSTI